MNKPPCHLPYLLYLAVIVPLFAYGGFLVYRGHQLYDYFKSQPRGWSGKLFLADSQYGLTPNPGAQGQTLFPDGDSLPTGFDGEGFRYCPEPDSAERPVVLFLGCSLTFGDACIVQDVFPSLVADSLQCRSLNAGVPSWGLAQMLLRASVDIPKYQPDAVVVQYSHWLVDRALSPFAPIYFGRLPTPYFYLDNRDNIAIEPPVFLTMVFDLPATEEYRSSQRSFGDFAGFFCRVSVPLMLHDHWNLLCHQVKLKLGVTPKPMGDRERLVEFVYHKIADLCSKNGARMVILKIGLSPQLDSAYSSDLQALQKVAGATLVDADAALFDSLGTTDLEAYERRYYHWRGDPPELVDTHPNPAAHRIIASALLESLLELLHPTP